MVLIITCPMIGLIESENFIDFLENCGAKIAADDLCSGLRSFYPVDGKGSDPLEKLIHRYQNKFPCPSRSRAEDRLPEILKLISKSGAKCVIFIVQKFCTPHLSDYPFLSEELRKEGIPSLLIEVDETWQAAGQLRTRIEGFFEIIE